MSIGVVSATSTKDAKKLLAKPHLEYMMMADITA
jgi:hypothetical protein